MSELISGADALRAIADGKEVEYAVNNSDWFDFSESKLFNPKSILLGINQNGQALSFRLKPRTIMIGDVEVPSPFEPKDGEEYWRIDSDFDKGYCCNKYISENSIQFGTWRTEEEIKQVVAALRAIFNP